MIWAMVWEGGRGAVGGVVVSVSIAERARREEARGIVVVERKLVERRGWFGGVIG